MLQRKRDALSELEPDGLGPEGPLWRQRKSAQTRTVILEAAIDCLSESGYANLTTQLVVKVARISRGAMLHHYATKLDLVASLIDYVYYKRMEWFLGRIAALTEKQRVKEFVGLDVLREALSTRYYRAYLELSVAARTDRELKAIFLPKARRFDRIWIAENLKVFPEWRDTGKTYHLARHLVAALMDGILVNREIWDDSRTELALLDLTRKVLGMMLSGELDAKSEQRASRRAQKTKP